MRVWSRFESVRNALKVSREMNSCSSSNHTDIETMGKELNKVMSVIKEEAEAADGEL